LKTKEKCAIKIINKTNLQEEEIVLIRTEIEILKICHHPNIIKMHNVFEDKNNIYLLFERCYGGDLFSYFEKRNFKLEESRVCQIVHKLSTAIYYLHSYGIIHRDLKLENIIMENDSDASDIKLLDFGLSTISGPNELCYEPFGTIVYIYKIIYSLMLLLKF
jgi:serine/threonine protein kinase